MSLELISTGDVLVELASPQHQIVLALVATAVQPVLRKGEQHTLVRLDD